MFERPFYEVKMYVQVTIQEMEEFLKADKGWTKHQPMGQEIHFDFRKKSLLCVGEFVIRVHSSIPSDGVSRDRGKDAIRVSIVVEVDGKDKGIRRFPRVTRQANWRKYLKQRVMEAFSYISSIRGCPQCHSPLALRKAKENNKEFYGCTRFPLCRYSERVK